MAHDTEDADRDWADPGRVAQSEELLDSKGDGTFIAIPWRVVHLAPASANWWAVEESKPVARSSGRHDRRWSAEAVAAWATIEVRHGNVLSQQVVGLIDSGEGGLRPMSGRAVLVQGESPEDAYSASYEDDGYAWWRTESCGSDACACKQASSAAT